MEDTSRPSGIVAFLLTDIEGATRRWTDDADAMPVKGGGPGETSPSPDVV